MIFIYILGISTDISAIKTGNLLVIKAVTGRDNEEPYPWIGRSTGCTAKYVYVRWLQGTYDSVWEENTEFINCKPDRISKSLVLASINWDLSKTMPVDIVKKLKKLYGETEFDDSENDE